METTGQRETGRMRGWKFYLAIGLLLSCTYHATARVEYAITDLGSNLDLNDINDNGQVVGHYPWINGMDRGFVYDNGVFTDIGTLGGSCNAKSINNSGVITGHSFDSNGVNRAFVYFGGVMKDIGTLGGGYAQGWEINNKGQITGVSGDTEGRSAAFLYDHGVMSNLGTLGGKGSSARDINNHGHVVGYYRHASGVEFSAFLYKDGAMHDLGILGSYSKAYSINDKGQIVGHSLIEADGRYHVFLYEDGLIKDLGLSSTPKAINNDGQIINGPYIYNKENGMRDLNDLIDPNSGWYNLRADDMNNRGEIVGTGYLNGEQHGVLLKPIDSKTHVLSVGVDWGVDLRGDTDAYNLSEILYISLLQILLSAKWS